MTLAARMPRTSPRSRPADWTPLDLGRALVLDELRRRRSGDRSILDPLSWALAGTVQAVLATSPRSAVLPHSGPDVESVLTYLAELGLVEEAVPEAQVRPARPQLYRWGRRVTTASLERWATGGVPAPGVCSAEDCGRPRAAGSRFCCRNCEARMAWRVEL